MPNNFNTAHQQQTARPWARARIDDSAAVGVAEQADISTLYGARRPSDPRCTVDSGARTHDVPENEWILSGARRVLVTVGYDHTDRKLEVGLVAKSKNIYLNVIARDLWPCEEIKTISTSSSSTAQSPAAGRSRSTRRIFAMRSCPLNTGSKIWKASGRA